MRKAPRRLKRNKNLRASKGKSCHSPSRRKMGTGKTAGFSKMRGAQRYLGYVFSYDGTCMTDCRAALEDVYEEEDTCHMRRRIHVI